MTAGAVIPSAAAEAATPWVKRRRLKRAAIGDLLIIETFLHLVGSAREPFIGTAIPTTRAIGERACGIYHHSHDRERMIRTSHQLPLVTSERSGELFLMDSFGGR
jgi:hypothetical protein